jgi:hypothetical protein
MSSRAINDDDDDDDDTAIISFETCIDHSLCLSHQS